MSAPAFDPAGILAALNARAVDYLLIGGLAVIAHGHLRATADVDILPRPDADNYGRLAAGLGELAGVDAHLLGIDLDAPTLAQGANFTLTTRFGALDVMQDVPGVGDYTQLAGRRGQRARRRVRARARPARSDRPQARRRPSA